jgi:hypothetical protein
MRTVQLITPRTSCDTWVMSSSLHFGVIFVDITTLTGITRNYGGQQRNCLAFRSLADKHLLLCESLHTSSGIKECNNSNGSVLQISCMILCHPARPIQRVASIAATQNCAYGAVTAPFSLSGSHNFVRNRG